MNVKVNHLCQGQSYTFVTVMDATCNYLLGVNILVYEQIMNLFMLFKYNFRRTFNLFQTKWILNKRQIVWKLQIYILCWLWPFYKRLTICVSLQSQPTYLVSEIRTNPFVSVNPTADDQCTLHTKYAYVANNIRSSSDHNYIIYFI